MRNYVMKKKIIGFIMFFYCFAMGCGQLNTIHENEMVTETQTEINHEVVEQEKFTVWIPLHMYESEKIWFKKIALEFQNKYPEYCVDIIQENEEMARSLDSLLKAGEGPDIFPQAGLYTVKEWIEKGYITEWKDIVCDRKLLWDGLLENGFFYGQQYGIPYQAYIDFYVVRRDCVEGESDWNLDAVRNCMEKRSVTIAMAGVAANHLANKLLLAAIVQGEFVDKQNKLADFHSTEFYNLLAFAREYGDIQEYAFDRNRNQRELQKGTIFGSNEIYSIYDLCTLDALLPGEGMVVGYPTSNGAASIGDARNFFLNKSSKHTEAAAHFVEYLLTKEAQDMLVDVRLEQNELNISSLRKDSMERYLMLLEERRGTDKVFYETRGEYYSADGITEVQRKELQNLFEHLSFVSGDDNLEINLEVMPSIINGYLDNRLDERQAAKQLEDAYEALWK